MINNDGENNKSIAGVPQAIFLTLPKDDQVFLKMLDRMNIELETVYKKASGLSPGKEDELIRAPA